MTDRHHSQVSLAYAAGFFDGEGHISISYHKANPQGHAKSKYARYGLAASVSQVHPDVIDWFKQEFGGHTMFCSGKRSYDTGRYTRWEWKVGARSAADFLKAIYPHLVVKRLEAEVAIAFHASMLVTGRARVPEHVMKFREECFQKIRDIRHRPPAVGFPDASN